MSGTDLEQRIDQIVSEHVNPRGPGLAVLVARGEQILVDKGYGLADLGTGESITQASRFVIGSVTKQFTCMALMLLACDERIDYDDPVGKYLPEMPATWRDRVTLRQLMHHTSGVPEYLTEEFWQAGAEYPDVASILRLIGTLSELEFEPGTRWRYCNSGYIILGEVITRVAGQSFASYLQQRVFEPLGMANTVVGESAERLPRLTVGYNYKSRERAEPAPWHFAVIGGADGNVLSNTHDLHLWAEAQQDCVLLPPEVAAKALVPCKPMDPAFSRYGFGVMISERRGVREISHGGGTLGYVTHLARFPDERLSIVILSNAAGIKLGEIRGRIANLLLTGKLAPLEPVFLAAGRLAEKTGAYAGKPRDHQILVEVSLEEAEGQLIAVITYAGTEQERYSLVPLAEDLFCADLSTDTYISFTRESGQLNGLRIIASGSVVNLDRVGPSG